MKDPIKSGAIFRVANADVLRTSVTPFLRTGDKENVGRRDDNSNALARYPQVQRASVQKKFYELCGRSPKPKAIAQKLYQRRQQKQLSTASSSSNQGELRKASSIGKDVNEIPKDAPSSSDTGLDPRDSVLTDKEQSITDKPTAETSVFQRMRRNLANAELRLADEAQARRRSRIKLNNPPPSKRITGTPSHENDTTNTQVSSIDAKSCSDGEILPKTNDHDISMVDENVVHAGAESTIRPKQKPQSSRAKPRRKRVVEEDESGISSVEEDSLILTSDEEDDIKFTVPALGAPLTKKKEDPKALAKKEKRVSGSRMPRKPFRKKRRSSPSTISSDEASNSGPSDANLKSVGAKAKEKSTAKTPIQHEKSSLFDDSDDEGSGERITIETFMQETCPLDLKNTFTSEARAPKCTTLIQRWYVSLPLEYDETKQSSLLRIKGCTKDRETVDVQMLHRISMKEFLSTDGQKCILEGEMDIITAFLNQLPEAIGSKFLHGIPVHWKSICSSATTDADANFASSKELTSKKPQNQQGQDTSKLLQKDKRVSVNDASEASSLEKTTTNAKKCRKHSTELYTDDGSPDIETANTPVVKRTRSGRSVKPLMDWWRNERSICDVDGNVSIDPGTHDHISTPQPPRRRNKAKADPVSENSQKPSPQVAMKAPREIIKAPEDVQTTLRTKATGVKKIKKDPRTIVHPTEKAEPMAKDGAKVYTTPAKALAQDLEQKGTKAVDVKETKEEGLRDAWSNAQIEALRVAERETDPRTRNFWGAVARRVDGKTAEECQQKWFGPYKTPDPKKKKRVEEDGGRSKVQGVVVEKLAGVKTKKFKKQVRQFVQELEKQQTDDLFQDNTPIKGRDPLLQELNMLETPVEKNKPAVAQTPNDVEEEDDDDGDGLLRAISPESRQQMDSYVSDLNKQTKKVLGSFKPILPTPSTGAQLLPSKMSVSVSTLSGSHQLQGSITPGGTTRIKIQQQNDDDDDSALEFNYEDFSADEEEVDADDYQYI